MTSKKTANISGTQRFEEQHMNSTRTARKSLAAALTLALAASVSTTAQAIEFTQGELSGSFDTTISYGAIFRADDLDVDNVGKAYWDPYNGTLSNAERRESPGRWSVNNDDGNRNYPDGGDLSAPFAKFLSFVGLPPK